MTALPSRPGALTQPPAADSLTARRPPRAMRAWHHRRMSLLQKLAAALLVILLAAAGYGLWTTSPAATSVRAQRAAARASPASDMPVIDQDMYVTAKHLARLATTAEEQPLAQTAVQIADHELDLAFTAAIHHLEAHPPVLSAEALEIQQRLLAAQKELESDTQEVKRLTAALAQAGAAAKPALQDRLDLAPSQRELVQDEVQEANSDLLQAGGNVHQRIQMMQQEHDATERNAAATPASTASPLGSLRGLVGQVRQWLALSEKRRALAQARRHAADSAAQLATERQQIAAELAASKQSVPELAARRAKGSQPASALSRHRPTRPRRLRRPLPSRRQRPAPPAAPPSLLPGTRVAAAAPPQHC